VTIDVKSRAVPHNIEAAVKSSTEKIQNRFRPKRELKNAIIGIMMTLDSMYPVETQAISSTVAPSVPRMPAGQR